MPAIFRVRFLAMAGMDLGNEKQMSVKWNFWNQWMSPPRWFQISDLASAEKSVKKQTQFFSECKRGTRSSKFVFYVCVQYNFSYDCQLILYFLSMQIKGPFSLELNKKKKTRLLNQCTKRLSYNIKTCHLIYGKILFTIFITKRFPSQRRQCVHFRPRTAPKPLAILIVLGWVIYEILIPYQIYFG